MSFDVSMRTECPHCHHMDVWMDENVTHNVNGIANACLESAGAGVGKKRPGEGYSWWRLDGWTGKEVLPIAEAAMMQLMSAHRQPEWATMEPSNGWGSRKCVERVLRAIITAAREHPDAIVRASG